ncbi:energy transducer TonB [Tamlana sp. I1]|uniref:energy transducer TonB n=1 Tax=Tamlana sp. I1 TaxID=2762061 RepID=UPI001E56583D|nr:energy transducer TonB [Tamlana sp. I1]
MNLTNQHRALLITLLISGTVLLLVFNLSLNKQNELASESYYEIEPEQELTPEELKTLEALDQMNNAKAETNKAFNEAQEHKHFAQAFKSIAPPKDYVPKSNDHGEAEEQQQKNDFKPAEDAALNQEELSKFSKVNEILKKQQANNNSKSSIRFSLLNREKEYIPIPVYLCEVNGKIVINITVNANGDVTETDVNTAASSSDNECLVERALEYAKQSRFSEDSTQKSQIGTITFMFVGKR